MIPRDTRLEAARWAIDRIDAGIIGLAALRRWTVGFAATAKPAGCGRDPSRENRVRDHARQVAADLGLPEAAAERLSAELIADACRQQGLPADEDQGGAPPQVGKLGAMEATRLIEAIAARLPPPRALAPFVARIPARWPAQALETAVLPALRATAARGELDGLEGRTIGIEVTDLQWQWQVGLRAGRLCMVTDAPEAAVRGTATDLLLLAGRREDADTLFFQRRLVLTGDTELGLLARNLLDRLDWQDIPLPARILLSRAGSLAARCRDAWHARRRVVLPNPTD